MTLILILNLKSLVNMGPGVYATRASMLNDMTYMRVIHTGLIGNREFSMLTYVSSLSLIQIYYYSNRCSKLLFISRIFSASSSAPKIHMCLELGQWWFNPDFYRYNNIAWR